MSKERPILFSPAMVRAIPEKTQTRREAKLPGWATPDSLEEFAGKLWASDPMKGGDREIPCPYGKPGDRLWVRESFYQYGHWEPVAGKLTKGGRQKWKFVPDSEEVIFDSSAIPGGTWRLGRHNVGFEIPAWHKRLARFMPRKFSRITLEIVSVRVERLQQITADDCRAEGHPVRPNQSQEVNDDAALDWYQDLWIAINGKESWDANPFVWVIEFKRVEGGAK